MNYLLLMCIIQVVPVSDGTYCNQQHKEKIVLKNNIFEYEHQIESKTVNHSYRFQMLKDNEIWLSATPGMRSTVFFHTVGKFRWNLVGNEIIRTDSVNNEQIKYIKNSKIKL